MRKIKVSALVIVSIMFCSVIAFAQGFNEKNQTVMDEKTKEKRMERERMGGMIMQMMGQMQKQMVATSDGGVVVLAGNKLLKYDKDLNLVKEAELKTGVELKIDVGSMQEMVEKMKEKYGKHSKTMKEEGQGTENK